MRVDPTYRGGGVQGNDRCFKTKGDTSIMRQFNEAASCLQVRFRLGQCLDESYGLDDFEMDDLDEWTGAVR